MPGLSYNNGNENDRLKFSGKELDEEQGLKKYHFGWRDYNPELGRWNVVDPARQYASPYVYGGNNPIIGYDEDGRFVSLVLGFLAGAYLTGAGMEGTFDVSKWDIDAWEASMMVIGGLGGVLGANAYISDALAIKIGIGLGAGGGGYAIWAGIEDGNWFAGGSGSYREGDFTVDVSASIYEGGTGANGGINWDVGGSVYYTNGSGVGAPMPQYTMNNHTRSGYNNTYRNSHTFGYTFSYNGETGYQEQTFYTYRNNDFMFHYHNDHIAANKSDKGWTGGGRAMMNTNRGIMEFSTDVFTHLPHSEEEYSIIAGHPYYKQTLSQAAWNRGSTYFRFNNLPVMLSRTLWAQDGIHDFKSRFGKILPRFFYNPGIWR
jgi:RHS repeat-associated protein